MDIVFRAFVLFAFLLLVMRVSGRRELSSLTPFDLLLLVVVGDLIQQGLTQSDNSVTGAMIAVATIAGLSVFTSWLSFRSRTARRVLEGEPIVLVQNGNVIETNLRRERMTEDELTEEMRLNQIGTLDEVAWAVLEPNGQISFVKKQG
jgi:uncharacterized membrane protein YcaP (DUF421 family)